MINLKHILKLSFILILLFNVQSAFSQDVFWGGLVDFEFRDGGKQSSSFVNQTPGDKPSFFFPNIRLFFGSQLNDQFFVEGALQADHYEGKSLSSPFISLLSINYSPFDSKAISFTGGRFILPFGSYSEKFISSQNPFVHLPVSHTWYQLVDKRIGFIGHRWNSYSGSYLGQNLVYQRMYTQGIMASGSLGKGDIFSYNLALTLASPSSFLEFAHHDMPTVISRVKFKPWIGLQVGGSIGYGAYMKGSDEYVLPQGKSISDYNQLIYGLDASFEYTYYSLNIEWIKNNWEAPLFVQGSLTGGTGWPYLNDVNVDNNFYSAEFIYRMPFLVGSYFAIRYEMLNTNEVDLNAINYPNSNPGDSARSGWDVNRYEFVLGTRLSRSIRLKTSYLLAENDGTDWDDDVFSIQLSLGF